MEASAEYTGANPFFNTVAVAVLVACTSNFSPSLCNSASSLPYNLKILICEMIFLM